MSSGNEPHVHACIVVRCFSYARHDMDVHCIVTHVEGPYCLAQHSSYVSNTSNSRIRTTTTPSTSTTKHNTSGWQTECIIRIQEVTHMNISCGYLKPGSELRTAHGANEPRRVAIWSVVSVCVCGSKEHNALL